MKRPQRPRAVRATVQQFAKAVGQGWNGAPDEKMWVCTWGPILLVVPAERRAWRS